MKGALWLYGAANRSYQFMSLIYFKLSITSVHRDQELMKQSQYCGNTTFCTGLLVR